MPNYFSATGSLPTHGPQLVGFKVHKERFRDVLPGCVHPAADGLVARHEPAGLDVVLQAVQSPAGVADVDRHGWRCTVAGKARIDRCLPLYLLRLNFSQYPCNLG